MKILLLAGEESGVVYADRIRQEVLKRHPEAVVRGYGDFGFRVEDLAVMGLGQVLKRIFYFLGVRRTMQRAIDEWRPDVVCTVDYPGLNLRLAAYAKARGIQTVHVVCPQVWAWKKGRIPKIEAALDRLCCFFPFEPALFRSGLAVFVGHPLVDEMAEKGPGVGDRESGGRTLAILPGSRLGEIEKHMPVLLRAVESLQHEIPNLQVVIPAANDRAYDAIRTWLSTARTSHSNVRLIRGGAREVLRRADAAVVASGTATLEAAIANCPTVLVYRVGWLFAALARILIKGVRHVGLANIIAEKSGAPCPMPELLQEDFTVENVLGRIRPLLTDESANADMRRALSETMRLLGSDGGAIARIVDCLRPCRS